jgi:hypothetical protein
VSRNANWEQRSSADHSGRWQSGTTAVNTVNTGLLEPNTGSRRHTSVMRPLATVSSALRLLALVVVCASLLAGGWLWLHRDNAGAEVVDASSHAGWMTIRYQGVRVDIPASWERLDMGDCEFQFEVWAPPDSESCAWTRGMAFYRSATFDPSQKPGVRRAGTHEKPEWGGYTYAGALAVYASDDDRGTVLRVLKSAR